MTKEPQEKKTFEQFDDECKGLIPDTFIVCGEDRNFCSDMCYFRFNLHQALKSSK